MGIQQILEKTGLPVAYGRFKEAIEPPFLVYMGNGQNVFAADNTHYHSENLYRVEYYFIEKRAANEEAIEETLLDNGCLFEKSEDEYIDTEDVFVIYYYINTMKGQNYG